MIATVSLLAIAGNVDCIAVLPAAATSMTRNNIMIRSRGMTSTLGFVAWDAWSVIAAVSNPLIVLP